MKTMYYLLILLAMAACSKGIKPGVEEVLNADRSFSAMSAEKGFPAAFIEYAHPDAVLLHPNSMPVKGKNAIAEIYSKEDTTGILLTWEPLAGDIAASGELGYTYGIYTFKSDSVVEKGKYTSIWKKDAAGKWKYVLDIGNKGLGN